MDRCSQCDHIRYPDDPASVGCHGCHDWIMTQLSKANERRDMAEAELAKYRGMEVELAALKNEREELAIAFHALEPAAHDGRLIALYGLPSHESYKTFARIFRVE